MTLSARILSLLSLTIQFPVGAMVVINEIHYDHEPKTQRGEFVELYNAGASTVDLSGWHLGGAVEFVFPGGTKIAAGKYLVIAEDPSTVESLFALNDVLGPYNGRLSNDGERLDLENPAGESVDAVDYGIGFPWPSAARGGGASMELINPELDNDLGGSWRSSQSGFSGPQATYLPAGALWSYRPGSSEASEPTDAWRMAGFALDDTWQEGRTVIGFGDNDDITEITGMQGNYVSLFLRKEFELNGQIPNELLVRVYYDDGAIVWINGVEVARLNVDTGDITFKGRRASDSPNGTPGAAVGSHERAWEDVLVSGASGFLVGGTNTIAVHALNTSTGSSDLSIDIEVRTPPPGELAIGNPTPGSANTVFSPNAPPIIRQVKHTPQQPVSGQAVTISTKVTDPDGVATVTLSYQIVKPGAYIRKSDPEYELNWTELPMEDGDGDDIFSINLPGDLQIHRNLLRYRIAATDALGNSVMVPFTDDECPNFAYFCYDGIPDWKASKRPGALPELTYPANALDSIAVYHLITRESDVILCQWSGPTDSQYRYLGTWVYDGIVYDHMRYRIRGNASVRQVGRNKWKFNFNRAHPFAARDNYGRKYKVPWDKINVLPGSNPWWRNNASTDGTMFCESVGFRLYQLAGGLGSNTQFFHFRVIDSANEAPGNDQYAGDFWGMYIAIEQPEAEFLNERGLPDGNIYNVHGGSGSSLRNQAASQVSNKSDLYAFQGLHTSSTSQAQWEANLDLNSYFAFNAINLAINNSDMRPQENINYYHNSQTDKWHILPWDIDLTFEDAPHLGRGDTSAWERIYNCLRYTQINQAYENKVREILDLLLDNDQAAHLVDEYATFMTKGGANNLVEATQAMWDFHPRKRKKGIWYANHNSALLPSRDFASLTQYTKDFLTVAGYGRSNLAGKQIDNAIPNRPSIAHTGPANFPADALTFSSSAFSDPNGSQSFGKMQWRIGHIHNPSTPGYTTGDRYIYEAETAFVTEEFPAFAADYTFPALSARPGATYRARVRHIDNTGRASHWSQPLEFTVSAPDITAWQQGLVITEIMYHPLPATAAEIAAGFQTSDFEWIELTNIGNTPLNLDNVRFTKGIDFNFADGTIRVLAPGQHLLVVRNAAAFASRHGDGFPIAGEFPDNKLNNAGENVKLSFGAGTAIEEFSYSDNSPWPGAADGEGFSLVRVNSNPLLNPADPASWRASVAQGGNPNASDTISFNPATDELVSYALGPYPKMQANSTPEHGIIISYDHNLAADDARIGIETSSNGVDWRTAEHELSSTMHNNDGTEKVTLLLSAQPKPRQQFIRLRISLH